MVYSYIAVVVMGAA